MTAGLKVVAPGAHTTVQDLGRFGWQDLGVPVSGALDGVSLRAANALVGNPPGAAALEILLHGPTLEVLADSVRLALAGDGVGLEILGESRRTVAAWRSVRLVRGQAVRVGALAQSACCYLAVEGGVAVPEFLGSASTFVRGRVGGLAGRPLARDDLLPLALERAETRGELRLGAPPDLGREEAVRVVLGPQHDHFTEAAIETFLGSTYRVSPNADRMGMRLDGPVLRHSGSYNIVSDGIATGAVQVPGNGLPILLLADHQTTGGYPKIATVISADLTAVGRRRPGDPIRFAAIDVAEAERLRRDAEERLMNALERLEPAPETGGVDLDRLYAGNLISGVVCGFE